MCFTEKPLSESELQNCLSIICMLSGDACNRAKIRRSGALQQLLERAKNYSTLKEMSMVSTSFRGECRK